MKRKRPTCYGCDRKARKGSLFCSQRCAADYAEELILGNDEVWCPVTGQWEGATGGECQGCEQATDSAGHIYMNDWSK